MITGFNRIELQQKYNFYTRDATLLLNKFKHKELFFAMLPFPQGCMITVGGEGCAVTVSI